MYSLSLLQIISAAVVFTTLTSGVIISLSEARASQDCFLVVSMATETFISVYSSVSLSVYITTLLLLMIATGLMVWKLTTNKFRLDESANVTPQQIRRAERDRKASRVLLVTAICFIILGSNDVVSISLQYANISSTFLNMILKTLIVLNPSVNIIIYITAGADFRLEVKKILCKCE